MNNRRKLVIALGASALTVPLDVLRSTGEQGLARRVPVTSVRPASLDSAVFGAFAQGMRDLGYVEGKNLVIEWRFADGKFERLPELAAELVQLKVDVIVTVGPQATSAAQKATTTIPIVMVVSNDPVRSGLVASLAHPGGNITGVSNFSDDLSPKHLEMLLSMVPKLSRLAILTNPTNAGHSTMLKSVETAAQKFRVKILAMEARSLQEIENAFAVMVREKAGAIIVMLDPVFVTERGQIAELAAKHRLPSVASFREYVEAGGLMSYGPNLAEHFRRMTMYVDKILKGAKPADLPVEQPTKFELLINRKTAKALGPHHPAVAPDQRRQGDRVRPQVTALETLVCLLRVVSEPSFKAKADIETVLLARLLRTAAMADYRKRHGSHSECLSRVGCRHAQRPKQAVRDRRNQTVVVRLSLARVNRTNKQAVGKVSKVAARLIHAADTLPLTSANNITHIDLSMRGSKSPLVRHTTSG